MARPASPLSWKVPLAPLRMTGGSGTGIAPNDWPTRSPATIRGTSDIKLCGR